jgi:hypothetical protein
MHLNRVVDVSQCLVKELTIVFIIVYQQKLFYHLICPFGIERPKNTQNFTTAIQE